MNFGKVLQVLACITVGSAFAKQGLEQIIIREFSVNKIGMNYFWKFIREIYSKKSIFSLIILSVIFISASIFFRSIGVGALIASCLVVVSILSLTSEFLRSQNSKYICQIVPAGLQPIITLISATIAMQAEGKLSFEFSFLFLFTIISSIVLFVVVYVSQEVSHNDFEPNLIGRNDFLKINILNQSTSSIDIIIIGLVSGDTAVGLYGLFQRFLYPYLLILSAMNAYFGRTFTKYRRDHKNLFKSFLLSAFVGGVIGVAISTCLYFFIPIMINKGNSDYSGIVDLKLLLLLTGLVVLATGAGATFLSMVGKHKQYLNFLTLTTAVFFGALLITGIVGAEDKILLVLCIFLISKALISLLLSLLHISNNQRKDP